MATTSISTTSTTVKCNWNSPVDAEVVFEDTFNGLRTKMIMEDVWKCTDVAKCDAEISPAPPGAHSAQPTYPARVESHNKSVRVLNAHSNKAMGLLLDLFHPGCNAHRDLTEWFSEDIAGLTAAQRRRVDFNFRNAWTKWLAVYKPDKQANLNKIKKMWLALTDAGMPMAQFIGQYRKFMKEMAEIGHIPSSEECYEMLRHNVSNPNLRAQVNDLNKSVLRRCTIEEFFDDCLSIVQNDPSLDSGKKRKADEDIVGRKVSITKPKKDSDEVICFRCGQPGHRKFEAGTKAKCSAKACVLCFADIGSGPHDARYCCGRSESRFSAIHKSDAQERVNRNGRQGKGSQRRGSRGKKSTKAGNSTQYGPGESSSSSTVSTVPITAKQAREYEAKLAIYKASQSESSAGRRVTSAEEDGSRA